MKSCNNIKCFFTAVAVLTVLGLTLLTGCTTTADYTLGQEFAPSNQQMLMRTRSYRNGIITEQSGEQTPCNIFETRLFKTDSVAATSLSTIFLGVQHDDVFGDRKMGYASQIIHMGIVDDSLGFGFHPVFDSALLHFVLDTFVGDTLKPMKFNIYELSAPIVAADAEDTTFYTSYDPRAEGHLKADAKPIFSFQFPDYANGVYTTSTRVRLKQESEGEGFIDRLFCMDKLDENGLANHNAEAYQSDSAFVSNFHGIWIEPAEESLEDDFLFAFPNEDAGFSVYGRVRNSGVDADIVTDTISMAYYYYDEKASSGNISAQSIKYDYTGSEVARYVFDESAVERDQAVMGYVDGCAGVITELYLTDEFLLSLRDINSNDDEYVSAAINQAQLRFYIKDAVYDYDMLDPIKMGEQMDHSILRLGMYTDYKTLTPIVDYLYEDETSSDALYYDGYLNRSLAAYEMNISSFIQGVVNEVLALKEDENGEVDLSKLTIPRKIYVAPTAYNRYTMHKTIFQGSDSEQNAASIELRLTYTLVK